MPAKPSTPSASSADDLTVTIRGRDWYDGISEILKIPNNPSFHLRQEAMRWSYLVGNRAKWQSVEPEARNIDEKATQLVETLGIDDALRRQLAQMRMIEVSIPWVGEETGWELRILPWEFILVRALRPYNMAQGNPLIVRCLEFTQPRSGLKPVGKVLGAWSCPREQQTARNTYNEELELIAKRFGTSGKDVKFKPLANASSATLQKIQEKDGPFDAIHFLSSETTGPQRDRSYVWLPQSDGSNAFEFQRFAQFLTGGNTPRLVVYNFCSTGPRLAAFTVAQGAHSAIGFQDVVTDEQALSFLGGFYSLWGGYDWDVLPAFEKALRDVIGMLQGAGIILWSDRSLLDTLRSESGSPDNIPAATSPAPGEAAANEDMEPMGFSEESFGIPTVLRPPGGPLPGGPLPGGPGGPEEVPSARDRLRVTKQPWDQINYSVLHNQQVKDAPSNARRTLFQSFQLSRLQASSFDVDVEVILYCGDHMAGWRQLVTVDRDLIDLAGAVQVPLTSVLARSLHESLRTTVQTIVRLGRDIIDRTTHPVSLLAIEEWRDDGVCHVWLPSFVLPRDPAVAEIEHSARRCLRALTDDYSAGFDGYQLGLPTRVDQQVQALWATLSLERTLSYINPPPTFSERSQRLRSPSEIHRTRSGTCLDLSLLLAACMEYIDLRPVIILAPGHAFVGWWRNEATVISESEDIAPAVLENFKSFSTDFAFVSGASILDEKGAAKQHWRVSAGWAKGKAAHSLILTAVERGDLEVIEATGLTRGISFARAVQEGRQRLRRRIEFECLIDVRSARQHGVTPLPMCQ